MSPCADWRKRILEADLVELRGAGGSELSAHLESCSSCRARAEAVLRTSRGLARALEVAAAGPSDADVDAVLARLDGHPSSRAVEMRHAAAPPGAARWLPLAAAALIAGLLALPTAEPTAEPTGRRTPPSPPAMPAAVEAPEGRNVVVLPTTDPRITVLWFY